VGSSDREGREPIREERFHREDAMTPLGCDTDEARACYRRIEKRLREQGAWRDEFALGLAPMAVQCAAYLRDARALAAIKDDEQRRLLEIELKRAHRLTRAALKLWFVALAAPEMNAQGEDAQIAKLCAPLPELATPLNSNTPAAFSTTASATPGW
jgi:NAD(P)-dependent dehydrogenase (short-subunit alcohol dehydrogenase family)